MNVYFTFYFHNSSTIHTSSTCVANPSRACGRILGKQERRYAEHGWAAGIGADQSRRSFQEQAPPGNFSAHLQFARLIASSVGG